jgi:DNA-directed RNA polymerase specialized sigma24 family protein
LITLEDDGDLVEALRRGDLRAADRLVERYGDRVYTLARRAGATEEAAAETVERALGTAVREIATRRPESPLGSWICRLTARVACRLMDDVADLLGVSPVAVGRRVHEARLFVRERLAQAFRRVAS